jgi:hypothetical protein
MRWRAVLGATAQRQQRAFARALRNRWDKAAAAKAAADKAAAEKAAAEKAAAEKAAAVKSAAEKAAAEKAAAEKAAVAKRAADEKAAAEKAAAEKAAAEKAASLSMLNLGSASVRFLFGGGATAEKAIQADVTPGRGWDFITDKEWGVLRHHATGHAVALYEGSNGWLRLKLGDAAPELVDLLGASTSPQSFADGERRLLGMLMSSPGAHPLSKWLGSTSTFGSWKFTILDGGLVKLDNVLNEKPEYTKCLAAHGYERPRSAQELSEIVAKHAVSQRKMADGTPGRGWDFITDKEWGVLRHHATGHAVALYEGSNGWLRLKLGDAAPELVDLLSSTSPQSFADGERRLLGMLMSSPGAHPLSKWLGSASEFGPWKFTLADGGLVLLHNSKQAEKPEYTKCLAAHGYERPRSAHELSEIVAKHAASLRKMADVTPGRGWDFITDKEWGVLRHHATGHAVAIKKISNGWVRLRQGDTAPELVEYGVDHTSAQLFVDEERRLLGMLIASPGVHPLSKWLGSTSEFGPWKFTILDGGLVKLDNADYGSGSSPAHTRCLAAYGYERPRSAHELSEIVAKHAASLRKMADGKAAAEKAAAEKAAAQRAAAEKAAAEKSAAEKAAAEKAAAEKAAAAKRAADEKAAAEKAAAEKAAAEKAASLSMLRRAMTWIGLPEAQKVRVEEKAHRALDEDGFALRPLLASDASVLRSLEKLLETEHPGWLGKGKDVSKKYGPYDSLKLACAWKVDHPKNWKKYTAGVERVQEEVELLRRKGKDVDKVPGLPVRTARAAAEGFAMEAGSNEAILLHGTSPDRLLELLSTGFNERYSGTNAGTAFGDGVYLAEDVGKTDQYVGADSAYDPSSELHKRLYGRTVRHPGDVFYVLVVRAALGYPVRTQQNGKAATSMDNGAPIFPKSFRELSPVPGVKPPIVHHSLIAELGKVIERYREFVLFHSEYVHIDYVIAYHRCNGGEKLCTTDNPFMA